jgi:hypothetical protein
MRSQTSKSRFWGWKYIDKEAESEFGSICEGIYSTDCSNRLRHSFGPFSWFRCSRIRKLNLYEFNFGVNPAAITPSIKDGFARLKQLDLIRCRGDISIFVGNTPLHNLQSIEYCSHHNPDRDSEFISALTVKCQTSLKSIHLFIAFDVFYPVVKDNSFTSLFEAVGCCKGLEEFVFYNSGDLVMLRRSDCEVLSSLPGLRSLEITGCYAITDVVSPLAQCRELLSLRFISSANLEYILSSIGRNLKTLKVDATTLDSIQIVIENCPNLQCLDLLCPKNDKKEFGRTLQSELKRLDTLRMNGGCFQRQLRILGVRNLIIGKCLYIVYLNFTPSPSPMQHESQQ